MERAEVEEKSAENSKRTARGETLPHPYQASRGQIQESLRIIKEETSQLSESLLQEEVRIKELCVLLKQVLRKLNISFKIPKDIVPQTWKAQRTILTDEAHLIFANDKDEVKSKALVDHSPQVILNVVSFIIPKLSRSLASYRKEVGSRTELFDRINHELRNLHNIFVNRSNKTDEYMNPAESNVVEAHSAGQKDLSKDNLRNESV